MRHMSRGACDDERETREQRLFAWLECVPGIDWPTICRTR